MMRIPTGELLAVMLGPLALDTCLKRLLLADDLHVGIMVPRPVHPTALPSTPLAMVVTKRAEASALAATGLHSGKLMFSLLNCLSSVTLQIRKTTKPPLFCTRMLDPWTVSA
jgi:hypothetical protein